MKKSIYTVQLEHVHEINGVVNHIELHGSKVNVQLEANVLSTVKEALAIDSDLYTPSLGSSLEERVQQRLRSELRRIRQPGAEEYITQAMSRAPMTSLRDIDTPIPFDAKEGSWRKLGWLR